MGVTRFNDISANTKKIGVTMTWTDAYSRHKKQIESNDQNVVNCTKFETKQLHMNQSLKKRQTWKSLFTGIF